MGLENKDDEIRKTIRMWRIGEEGGEKGKGGREKGKEVKEEEEERTKSSRKGGGGKRRRKSIQTFPLLSWEIHVLEALVVGLAVRLVTGIRILSQVRVGQCLGCRYTPFTVQLQHLL